MTLVSKRDLTVYLSFVHLLVPQNSADTDTEVDTDKELALLGKH